MNMVAVQSSEFNLETTKNIAAAMLNEPAPIRWFVNGSQTGLQTANIVTVPKVMSWLFCAYRCAATMAQAASEPAFPARTPSWFARVWRSDEGLPESNVTGVVQTSEDCSWVAPQAGLARFDGNQFRPFPLPSDPGVSRRMIRASPLDREHNLWLAREGGGWFRCHPRR